jgi:hypothetical protein
LAAKKFCHAAAINSTIDQVMAMDNRQRLIYVSLVANFVFVFIYMILFREDPLSSSSSGVASSWHAQPSVVVDQERALYWYEDPSHSAFLWASEAQANQLRPHLDVERTRWFQRKILSSTLSLSQVLEQVRRACKWK